MKSRLFTAFGVLVSVILLSSLVWGGAPHAVEAFQQTTNLYVQNLTTETMTYTVYIDETVTNFYVRNLTAGAIYSYTVHGTPQGDITCSNIPSGSTVLCGSFTSGTYQASWDTAECGSSSDLQTFPPGDVTHTVSCGAYVADLYVLNNPAETITITVSAIITCSDIPSGSTVFCGSFAPGSHQVSIDSTECGWGTDVVDFPPGDVTRTVLCSGGAPVHGLSIYLPYLIKDFQPPTKLYVRNFTTGFVTYTVHDTPQGTLTCEDIPAGHTVFCDTFSPGTYQATVDTDECGSNSDSVKFIPGHVTREVVCR